MEERKRITGKIIKLHPKGWGFISSSHHPFTRIYFHWSNLDKKVKFLNLRKDDIVSFICIDRGEELGLKAIQVKLEQ